MAAEETTSNAPTSDSGDQTAPAAAAKPAAKGKKPKEPAVEDKPFAEFIEQDFFPALEAALTQQGIETPSLTLLKQPLSLVGSSGNQPCSQVLAQWQQGQRQFRIYFLEGSIGGAKAFSYSTSNSVPSTLESFMIDERKITLDLLVFYTLQRLNGQKWLVRN
ncbi:MAG: DUF2996 domain-containing protein [Chloroflexaceae bacterium]|nr:DUF2996 domain-containing protein [Chloroflexaceae bacterium]